MKTSKLLGMVGFTFAISLFAADASARSLVCESVDGHTRTCPANTRDGVTLAVQYSKASCRQGTSWGYDRRGIWVSNGCRAQFDLGNHHSEHRSDKGSKAAAALIIGLIGVAAIAASHDDDHDRGWHHDDYDYRPDDRHRDYGPRRTLVCESKGRNHRYCDARISRGGRVEIERQLSKTNCRFGRNWGWDRRGVWVADGCRARFGIY